MRVIEPRYEIITKINSEDALKTLEFYGRNAYKSEDKITESSSRRFIKGIIKKGHESVLEHLCFTVRFIVDHGIEREIIRHRIGTAFTIASTRYCDYSKNKYGSDIVFIRPNNFKINSDAYMIWYNAAIQSELDYLHLTKTLKMKPEDARSVLLLSHATDIVMTGNYREWRHIFKLRTDKSAHPQMRQVMIPLLNDLKSRIPIIFDDIEV